MIDRLETAQFLADDGDPDAWQQAVAQAVSELRAGDAIEAARNEAKLRSGRIPDREILARFYDRHLPPDISTNRAFDRWRRVAEREHPKLLYLTQEDLEGQYESQPDEVSYPDTLPLPGGSSAR